MIRLLIAVASAVVLAGCISQQPAPAVDRNSSTQSRGDAGGQPGGPGYYTVRRGDTLYRIAKAHGRDQRDIAAWNNIVTPEAIKEGTVLRVVPPVAPVQEGSDQVVAKPIATSPGVESRSLDAPAEMAPVVASGLKREPRVGKEPYSDEAYARLNKSLEPAKVVETKPESGTAPQPVASGVNWDWPVKSGVDRGFGDSGSKGMDFGGKMATPIQAAADGKVIYAGEALAGYGKLLILKHGEEFNSVYAHNSKLLVKEGETVKRGQRIAEMGNTGSDTVKLHFEIRKQGKPVDPAAYLPKR